MKKVGLFIGVLLLSSAVFVLCFSTQKKPQPNVYYQVYLEGKKLGNIKSKKELEKYINNQGKEIKNNVKEYAEKIEAIDVYNEVISKLSLSKEEQESFDKSNKEEKVKYLIINQKKLNISDLKRTQLKKYLNDKLYNLNDSEIKEMKEYLEKNKIYLSAKNVYIPNGIDIKKVATYDNDVESASKMYAKIVSKKDCTIPGYKFIIKGKEEKENKIVYVTDKNLFSNSVDTLAGIFAGKDSYKKYKNKSQDEIVDTGSTIENVYVDEDIAYKAVNIPTTEKIYTDTDELSKYLLYGDNYQEKRIKVEDGESIQTLAFKNKISVDEFLISNDEYNNEDNLLYTGKEVVIAQINPQINVVVETHSVKDVESNFDTVEEHDANMIQGDEKVTQEGEKGLDRVTQNIKYVNGQMNYVQTEKKETLKAATSKIVTVGSKVVPNVGSTKSWGWPTNNGYTISSGFEYRINPVDGSHELHSGLDIAGTGYGSPVYVTNNGTIIKMTQVYNYGIHMIVDHGNGYYTLYAHMSGFASGLHVGSVVERGQQIGYVGATGYATGPHLHYEIRTCAKYACVTDPRKYY